MRKRVSRTTMPPTPREEIQKKTFLADIHRKITSSAALNGGFDTLLYKIDKIEQNQNHLVTKVDKIHEAIYDPSEGIFSKLSQHKLESAHKMGEVEQEILTLKAKQDSVIKNDEKNVVVANDHEEKLDKLESTVVHLERNSKNLFSFLKWLGVAVGGGVITLIFNYLSAKIH